MAEHPTCGELVALVREHGAGKALAKMPWLDEIADCDAAAGFTGISASAVRSYHGQARRKRRAIERGDLAAEKAGWIWPEPDVTLGGRPGWKFRTLVIGRAAMPGRGAGGGRPWPKTGQNAGSAAATGS